MVLMDEPAHVGCLLDVRIVGVIEAVQVEHSKRTVNNRLVGVAIHSYAPDNISSIDPVNPSVLKQVEEFFVVYNKSRGKEFRFASSGEASPDCGSCGAGNSPRSRLSARPPAEPD